MKREIRLTADGSTTIHLPDWGESYHSTHGAIQEAKHVFIKHGFNFFNQIKNNESSQKISILEIGFGTGLNCFITYLSALQTEVLIHYEGIEAFPITKEEVDKLNYVSELNAEDYRGDFELLHGIPWETEHKISSSFSLTKKKQQFNEINHVNKFDIVYFDAFGAEYQPELWTEDLFNIMYHALKTNGVLVTYSAKGSVRRAMLKVGFTVEKLPGPPGKREMLRARKENTSKENEGKNEI